MDATGRFRGEGNRARPAAGRQEGGAVAAVDVAAAVGVDRLEAGDGVQLQAGQAPRQARAGAGTFSSSWPFLPSVVMRDLSKTGTRSFVPFWMMLARNSRAEPVRFRLCRLNSALKSLPGRPQCLQADRPVVVALELLGRRRGTGRQAVRHPVAAVLHLGRHAGRPVAAELDVARTFDVDGAVAADRDAAVGFLALARLDRIELHHAGRCVAPEQRALRAGQHLDAVQVEDGEAFQQRVLLHHVVVDQRDRLRGVAAEVGVAVAADVEAREGTAEGRFDVQAGHPAGQHAQVLPAGVDDVELLAGEDGHRARHVLDVFHAALGGDGDRFQTPRLGLGVLRLGGQTGERGSDAEGQGPQAAGRGGVGVRHRSVLL